VYLQPGISRGALAHPSRTVCLNEHPRGMAPEFTITQQVYIWVALYMVSPDHWVVFCSFLLRSLKKFDSGALHTQSKRIVGEITNTTLAKQLATVPATKGTIKQRKQICVTGAHRIGTPVNQRLNKFLRRYVTPRPIASRLPSGFL
jgi:hypothetical protein